MQNLLGSLLMPVICASEVLGFKRNCVSIQRTVVCVKASVFVTLIQIDNTLKTLHSTHDASLNIFAGIKEFAFNAGMIEWR